jgi:alanyl-tRNA synthetase
VDHTGDIGTFIILSEASIASGIRRIEAITGSKAYEFIHYHLSNIRKMAAKLSSPSEEIYGQIELIASKNESDLKKMKELREKLALYEYEKNKKTDLEQIGDAVVYATLVEGADNETLRKLSDLFRKEQPSGVFAVASSDQLSGRFLLMVAVSDKLNKNNGINAVEIVKQISPIIGGGGGGKPLLAQAGGNDPSKLHNAFLQIKEYVKSKLSNNKTDR